MEGSLLCGFVGGFLEVLTVESVPEQYIKVFLDLSALCFLQIKLLITCSLLSFFKVNGINMVNTNQPQQEHTDIPGIDPIFLNQGIGIIHQPPLINRNAILWLLILLDKSHGFQYLIKHDIVNLVVDRQVNLQPLKHSKILPDKPLRGVFFIRIINSFLGFG